MSYVSAAPLPFWRFFDKSRAPLAGGQLWTFVAGTSSKRALFRDLAQTVPWDNPIILTDDTFLGGAGYVPGPMYPPLGVVLKYLLQDVNGVEQWTADNIATPVGSTVAIGVWQAFTPTWTNTGTANTLGNGTLTGRWRYTGLTTVEFVINFFWGSTTVSGNGTWLFGNLPFGGFLPHPILTMGLVAGVGTVEGRAVFNGPFPATAVLVYRPGIFGGLAPAVYSGTVPGNWANTDRLIINGDYEIGP